MLLAFRQSGTKPWPESVLNNHISLFSFLAFVVGKTQTDLGVPPSFVCPLAGEPPSERPSTLPTTMPSLLPTDIPSMDPPDADTSAPSRVAAIGPTISPTEFPTAYPTETPLTSSPTTEAPSTSCPPVEWYYPTPKGKGKHLFCDWKVMSSAICF